MLRVPNQGDIVLIEFDPQSGHEQTGTRPALVISNADFNAFGLIIVCPITNTDRGYPLHIKLPATGTKTKGIIMCDHVKSLDYQARNARILEKAPADIVREAIDIVQGIIEM